MTTRRPKKIHDPAVNLGAWLWLGLAGALEGLLLARLVLALFAARPGNPSFALLRRITDPLVLPLIRLDQGQPLFGARLEISTLSLAILVPIGAYLVWALLQNRVVRADRSASWRGAPDRARQGGADD